MLVRSLTFSRNTLRIKLCFCKQTNNNVNNPEFYVLIDAQIKEIYRLKSNSINTLRYIRKLLFDIKMMSNVSKILNINANNTVLKLAIQNLSVTFSRNYHEKVIDHYENPRNVGSLSKDDKDVGTGLVGAPACGDVMKLQIKVDENGKIIDAKFKTFGCGSAIASSSLATEWIKGKTMEQAAGIKNSHIAKELSLPPVKLHCSMLAEDAIKAALRDVRKKREAVSQAKDESKTV